MIAVIGDSGNVGSIALHAAQGFAYSGLLRSVGFKHGRWVDSVIMQRALGPGDCTLPGCTLPDGRPARCRRPPERRSPERTPRRPPPPRERRTPENTQEE